MQICMFLRLERARICKRRNYASGHWNGGYAVGKPRLVDPPEMARVSREGVVIRHNRLTEWV
jgi:hypothetical protein